MSLRILYVGLLVLGIATGALSVVSYFPTKYYTIVFPPSTPSGGRQPMELSVYKGSFYVDYYEYSGIGRSPKPGWREYGVINDPIFSERMWHLAHVLQTHPGMTGSVPFNRNVPLIPISLMSFGILLALAVRRRRRHQLLSTGGYCSICSYDLTGNVSGVCSECGTALLPEQRLRDARRK
jgi:hypothetical protein